MAVLSPDQQYQVSEIIRTGQAAGVHPEDIANAAVVWLSICSGDLILPWSADQIESLSPGIMDPGPTYHQVRDLMGQYPQFWVSASVWFAQTTVGL